MMMALIHYSLLRQQTPQSASSPPPLPPVALVVHVDAGGRLAASFSRMKLRGSQLRSIHMAFGAP